MQHLATSLLLLVPVLATSVACGGSLYRKKPADPKLSAAVTDLWEAEISAKAEPGDWILTRSYTAIGDVIAIGSGGEEISHAAIYDAEKNTIIEALGEGVREVPLRDLLDRNRVAIVVRPYGTTPESRLASLEKARKVLGSDFDYTGLFGAGADAKFYCSELVVWASGVEKGEFVITPSSLVKRGEIVYLSGNRDDELVQSVARRNAKRSALRTASR